MRFLQFPFGVLWRFVLVRLDRLVPTQVTHITSSPPYPLVVRIPSRDEKHKIALHISVPDGIALDEGEKLPIHVDFHGGGFFMGSCLEQAPFCALLAKTLRRIVISVDYRLGPVHKFPAAIHDAEDVIKAILEPDSAAGRKLREAVLTKVIHTKTHVSLPDVLDMDRISLSGFSSGGNLALNLALDVEHNGEKWLSPISHKRQGPVPILLFYPSFDQTVPPHERPLPDDLPPDAVAKLRNTSLRLGELLTPTYLSKADRGHPRASPGLVDLDAYLPGARMFLVLTKVDTLYVQSEAWLKKVEKEQKLEHVEVVKCSDMSHGWTQYPGFTLSKKEKLERDRVFKLALDFVREHELDLSSSSSS